MVLCVFANPNRGFREDGCATRPVARGSSRVPLTVWVGALQYGMKYSGESHCSGEVW